MRFFKRSTKLKRESIIAKLAREHGFWFWFGLFIIAVAAFNVASLSFSELTSLFYTLELELIAFLCHPISFQFWFWVVFFVIIWFSSYILTPVLSIPSTGELLFFPLKRESAGQVYFSGRDWHLRKTVIETSRGNVRRIGFHWFIVNEVIPRWDGQIWVYETPQWEVTESRHLARLISILDNHLAQLEEMSTRERQEFIEEVMGIVERAKGKGGGEE